MEVFRERKEFYKIICDAFLGVFSRIVPHLSSLIKQGLVWFSLYLLGCAWFSSMLVFVKPGTGVHDQQIPGKVSLRKLRKAQKILDILVFINPGESQDAFIP